MCVSIPPEIWNRHKDELIEGAKRIRARGSFIIIQPEVGIHGSSRHIDELLASIEARARHEQNELVPA